MCLMFVCLLFFTLASGVTGTLNTPFKLAFDKKLDVATKPTPHYENDSHLPTSLAFAFVSETGHYLKVDGAKALVPALKQMTHMTELDLGSKSRMTQAHGGVCWWSMRNRMRECVSAWAWG